MHFDLRCTFAAHHLDQIVGVCVNDICQHKRPSCFQCAKEFHSQHFNDVLDLKQFSTWMKDIENKKAKLLEFLAECEKLSQQVKKLNNFEAKNQDLSFEQLHLQVNQMTQLIKSVENMTPQLNTLNQLIKILLDEYPIRKKVCIKQNYQFSHTLKHIKILVQGNNIKANGEGFCFCEPEIKNFTSIEFQIIKGKKMYIGLCSEQYMQKYKFELEESDIWNKMNHGLYLIENDGYSYSHHQKEFNCQSLSFKFQENDIIIMEVNPEKKQITWYKKNTNEKFFLSYQLEGNLYAVVGLEYGGQISII